jgi:hypothetical protein
MKNWAGISGFLSVAILMFQNESSYDVIATLFAIALTLYGVSLILDRRCNPRVKALEAANQVLQKRHSRTF